MLTLPQQVRISVHINHELDARHFPEDMRLIVTASCLDWLAAVPNSHRFGPTHLKNCIQGYIQGWLKGAMDVADAQQSCILRTHKN